MLGKGFATFRTIRALQHRNCDAHASLVCATGVKAIRDPGVKDQFVFEGNDIELVSRSCSLIHQACLVRKKDIRKFLDGMYISEKGAISDE